jgi:hypothetical protein
MQYDSLKESNNRTKQVHYKNDFEWLAVVDRATTQIFYVPHSVCEGNSMVSLRMTPTRNNQKIGVRLAEQFTEI